MKQGPIRRRSLEYSLVDHCNLSCYGCDHGSPLLPHALTSLDRFVDDLRQLHGSLKVERLYLIGGEPLLHPGILDFIDAGKRSGIAEGIVVVTNGVLLHRVPDRFWQMVSGVDITIYPGITIRPSLDALVQKGLAHQVNVRVRRRDEFRHTLLNQPHTDSELVQRIFAACRIAHDYQCHSVSDGKYYKCSVAPHLPKRLRQIGITITGWGEDGVVLQDNPDLRDDLDRYLVDGRALHSCQYCLGTSGRTTAHHQLDAAGRNRWRAELYDDATELLDPTKLGPVRSFGSEVAQGSRPNLRTAFGMLRGVLKRLRPGIMNYLQDHGRSN